MPGPSSIYQTPLTLLTDLYQLTMAYGYWKSGAAEDEAVFDLFFRRHPFAGGYSIACGLEYVIDYLESYRFHDEDLEYIATVRGADGEPIFEDGFIEYLRTLEFSCDIDAIEEGRVVFPHQPLVRVSGPVLQAQLIETPLLNMINFQTLIATKAARVCRAARGEPVLEFGLRRAQGIDGGLAAARAAYVGGCAATSNVLAGKLFGIPVRGTHAHSWVMFFDTEIEAFDTYAEVMPNNCVFLVDTYDTVEGVRRAVEVGERLRQRGHEMIGIRLDSGDLAYLSIEARKILDAGGFPDADIVASNSLDEHVIESLKQQGAMIGVWGVGTKLTTAYDDAALGGVYKLCATRAANETAWKHRIKLSEQVAKVTTPGIHQVRRYTKAGEFMGDLIYDELTGMASPPAIVDPRDATRRKSMVEADAHEDLLVPVFRRGQKVYDSPGIDAAQRRCESELALFHDGIKRHLNPHEYPVGLDLNLYETKVRLMREARGVEQKEQP